MGSLQICERLGVHTRWLGTAKKGLGGLRFTIKIGRFWILGISRWAIQWIV